MLDQAYYIRLLEILSKDTQDKNTYAQANAKHILMSVDTDPADYPRFNLRLSDQADAQAFLYLEIGAGLFDAEREQAVFAFEKRGSVNRIQSFRSSKSSFNQQLYPSCGCSCILLCSPVFQVIHPIEEG